MSSVFKYIGNIETIEENFQFGSFLIKDIIGNLPKDKSEIPKELITSNDKDYEIALIYPSSPTIQEAIDVVKKEYENLKDQADIIAIDYQPYATTEQEFKAMPKEEFDASIKAFKDAINELTDMKIVDVNDYIGYDLSNAFLIMNPLAEEHLKDMLK